MALLWILLFGLATIHSTQFGLSSQLIPFAPDEENVIPESDLLAPLLVNREIERVEGQLSKLDTPILSSKTGQHQLSTKNLKNFTSAAFDLINRKCAGLEPSKLRPLQVLLTDVILRVGLAEKLNPHKINDPDWFTQLVRNIRKCSKDGRGQSKPSISVSKTRPVTHPEQPKKEATLKKIETPQVKENILTVKQTPKGDNANKETKSSGHSKIVDWFHSAFESVKNFFKNIFHIDQSEQTKKEETHGHHFLRGRRSTWGLPDFMSDLMSEPVVEVMGSHLLTQILRDMQRIYEHTCPRELVSSKDVESFGIVSRALVKFVINSHQLAPVFSGQSLDEAILANIHECQRQNSVKVGK